MPQSIFKPVAVVFALMTGSAACAASYTYTENYAYVGKTRLDAATRNAKLQSDLAACDSAVGVQDAGPSAAYRNCMIGNGWRYTSLSRSRVADDPNFSANVKLAPGHFIDHDNGMDCQHAAGAEVCDPPNGTVHYFDPDQNLPCTRTGASSVCSNF
jgi:hypothetical protein